MKRARTVAALLAALLAFGLAACGGGGGGSASQASQPPAAAQVAQQLGATGVQRISPTLYAYDEATATLHGQAVDIATFRTDALRDQWIQAAGQFTGIQSKGHLYAVADG